LNKFDLLINVSEIDQYNIHVNKLMHNKNQTNVIQNLLDNLTELINREIEDNTERYFSSALMENFEKLRRNFDESNENGIKFLSIFMNKFKKSLKDMIIDLQDITTRLDNSSIYLERIFNMKDIYSIEIQSFIEEEIGKIINVNHVLKMVISFIRDYISIQGTYQNRDKVYFTNTEIEFITRLMNIVDKYSEKSAKNKTSLKEEIITQIKLKNNQFSEVSDIDQLVKFIQTSGPDKKKKKNQKKTSKKKKNKNKQENQCENESDNENANKDIVEFEIKLKKESIYSNQVEKVKPLYSTNFLNQIKYLLETKAI